MVIAGLFKPPVILIQWRRGCARVVEVPRLCEIFRFPQDDNSIKACSIRCLFSIHEASSDKCSSDSYTCRESVECSDASLLLQRVSLCMVESQRTEAQDEHLRGDLAEES